MQGVAQGERGQLGLQPIEPIALKHSVWLQAASIARWAHMLTSFTAAQGGSTFLPRRGAMAAAGRPARELAVS